MIFKIITLGLMAAFYICYFVKMISQRKQGISTDLCLATGFVLVFFHLQIVNVEEEFLIETFGEEYVQYKKNVCRYFGRKL